MTGILVQLLFRALGPRSGLYFEDAEAFKESGSDWLTIHTKPEVDDTKSVYQH